MMASIFGLRLMDRLIVSSLRDSLIFGAYPGLTPWANVCRPTGPGALPIHRFRKNRVSQSQRPKSTSNHLSPPLARSSPRRSESACVPEFRRRDDLAATESPVSELVQA